MNLNVLVNAYARKVNKISPICVLSLLKLLAIKIAVKCLRDPRAISQTYKYYVLKILILIKHNKTNKIIKIGKRDRKCTTDREKDYWSH